MTYRIPPSLNWLIDKHARTAGKIIKLRKKLSDVIHLVELLSEYEKRLSAIEESLKLHDIQIDVQNIKPVKASEFDQNKFKPGQASGLVIDFLKSRYGQGPVPKKEIDTLLIYEHEKLAPGAIKTKKEFKRYSTQLLNRLAAKNIIIRMHSKATFSMGYWEINPELISQKTNH